MKRIYWTLGMLALASTIYAAANVAKSWHRNIVTSKSVTAQYTATTGWTLVDSVRVLQAGDSSASLVAATGEVDLAPGQSAYLGFGHTNNTTAGKYAADVDTFIIKGNPMQPGVKSVRLPFSVRYARQDSVALNDTFYFLAASSDSRPLVLRNIQLTASTAAPAADGKLATRF